MKVTFDGVSKLIIVNYGETALNVKTDIYSAWKNWVQIDDNAKYLSALRVVGGDPTVGANAVAPYFFLTNGWKIRPYEGNHTLNITGNLFIDDPITYGSNVTVPTISYYQVLVNMATTSDATIVAGAGALNSSDISTLTNAVWDAVLNGYSARNYILETHAAAAAAVENAIQASADAALAAENAALAKTNIVQVQNVVVQTNEEIKKIDKVNKALKFV